MYKDRTQIARETLNILHKKDDISYCFVPKIAIIGQMEEKAYPKSEFPPFVKRLNADHRTIEHSDIFPAAKRNNMVTMDRCSCYSECSARMRVEPVSSDREYSVTLWTGYSVMVSNARRYKES